MGDLMRRFLIIPAMLLAGCVSSGGSRPSGIEGDIAAPTGEACIAAYVHPGTTLARDLGTLNPPVRCLNTMVSDDGRAATSMMGAGKVDPRVTGGHAGFARRLVVIAGRFEEPSTIPTAPIGASLPGRMASTPLPRGLGEPVEFPVQRTTTIGGDRISLAAVRAQELGTPLELICVFGSNDTTGLSRAAVCRSLDNATTASAQALAADIIAEDLPAVRW
jgi:hypothetical protein